MNNGPKKILIIDDEAVYRDAFSECLTRCGYSCRAVDNSSDGLNMVKIGRYDLILLDIMMEPFDGWETLDSIRDLRQVDPIPVMMASAKLLDVDEILRYGERIVGFIRKPSEDADTCDLVNSFFSWKDEQRTRAENYMAHGVSAQETRDMTSLRCQIRVLKELLENVSPRCIPEEGLSEEDCLTQRKKEILDWIQEKENLLEEIYRRYPQLA